MRADAVGLFWSDAHLQKVKKIPKPKRSPPEPVWLAVDYLPGLDEALRFPVEVMTKQELLWACINKEPLLFDCEVYGNYFLIGFRSYTTGKVWYCELAEGNHPVKEHPLYKPFDKHALEMIFDKALLVGFNSRYYDSIVTSLAMAGRSTMAIKECSDRIINFNERGWDLLRAYRVKQVKFDHIDLIEVAPLSVSLKTYGARLHTPFLQDLPFHPSTALTADQIAITRWYCVGKDLTSTAYLYHNLLEQLYLRGKLSSQHDVDLRSKSDAQIAESIISKQISRILGGMPKRPNQYSEGTSALYAPVDYMKYNTEEMKHAFDTVCSTPLVINEHGRILLPEAIKALKIHIGTCRFQLGIGGLHSTEESVFYDERNGYKIFDIDATSFYPRIILNQKLYPAQLGPAFLDVFGDIVEQRIAKKRAGMKADADTLKIVINGTFGKTGSPHSLFYAPYLMIQTTLSGQLTLLLLAERLVLRGFTVVSGNTDGLVVLCPNGREVEFNDIVKQWESETKFEMESVQYASIHSRDVNNYIALKADGTVKGKGVFANPWDDPKMANFICHYNPNTSICTSAVVENLRTGADMEQHIRSCKDIRKFVSVRNVKGGAVVNTTYLGKVVRWYYSTNSPGEIIYAKTGNKVARSDGAMPCMDMPSQFPQDIDYEWYIRECQDLLVSLGHPALQA